MGIKEKATSEVVRSPFFYLKEISGIFFFLSLAGMVCAGLLFNDIRVTEANFLPETWSEMLKDGGAPQGLHFAMSVVFSLGIAVVAGIIYAFASVSERMLQSG